MTGYERYIFDGRCPYTDKSCNDMETACVNCKENKWEQEQGVALDKAEYEEMKEEEPCNDVISKVDTIAKIYDKFMTIDGGVHDTTAQICIKIIRDMPNVNI